MRNGIHTEYEKKENNAKVSTILNQCFIYILENKTRNFGKKLTFVYWRVSGKCKKKS